MQSPTCPALTSMLSQEACQPPACVPQSATNCEAAPSIRKPGHAINRGWNTACQGTYDCPSSGGRPYVARIFVPPHMGGRCSFHPTYGYWGRCWNDVSLDYLEEPAALSQVQSSALRSRAQTAQQRPCWNVRSDLLRLTRAWIRGNSWSPRG